MHYKLQKLQGIDHCLPTNTIACSMAEDGNSVERCLGRDHICNGYNDCPRLFDDEYGCSYGGT